MKEEIHYIRVIDLETQIDYFSTYIEDLSLRHHYLSRNMPNKMYTYNDLFYKFFTFDDRTDTETLIPKISPSILEILGDETNTKKRIKVIAYEKDADGSVEGNPFNSKVIGQSIYEIVKAENIYYSPIIPLTNFTEADRMVLIATNTQTQEKYYYTRNGYRHIEDIDIFPDTVKRSDLSGFLYEITRLGIQHIINDIDICTILDFGNNKSGFQHQSFILHIFHLKDMEQLEHVGYCTFGYTFDIKQTS